MGLGFLCLDLFRGKGGVTDISHVICVSLQLGQLLRGDNRHLGSSSRNFKKKKEENVIQLVREGLVE